MVAVRIGERTGVVPTPTLRQKLHRKTAVARQRAKIRRACRQNMMSSRGRKRYERRKVKEESGEQVPACTDEHIRQREWRAALPQSFVDQGHANDTTCRYMKRHANVFNATRPHVLRAKKAIDAKVRKILDAQRVMYAPRGASAASTTVGHVVNVVMAKATNTFTKAWVYVKSPRKGRANAIPVLAIPLEYTTPPRE